MYKLKHKEYISKYNKEYNEKNRKVIQKRHTLYLKNKRKTDINYKLRVNITNRMKSVMKGKRKCNKTLYLLGCTLEFLNKWLSYQFTSGMSFDNHGSVWHIDHVIPCSIFNLENEDHQRLCFNWKNLRPMLARDNLIKNNKISETEIYNHFKKANEYCVKIDILQNYSYLT